MSGQRRPTSHSASWGDSPWPGLWAACSIPLVTTDAGEVQAQAPVPQRAERRTICDDSSNLFALPHASQPLEAPETSLSEPVWQAQSLLPAFQRILREQVIQATSSLRAQVQKNIREMVGRRISRDKDVPAWIQSGVDAEVTSVLAAIDREMSDPRSEEELRLQAEVLRQRAAEHEVQCGYRPKIWLCCRGERCCACVAGCLAVCLASRAAFLRRYLPHDKSIFGRVKDPLWWLVVLAMVIPVFGIRVFISGMVLILLIVPERPDMHQLILWLLRFKASQFMTEGVLVAAADSVARLAGFRRDMSSGSQATPPGFADYEPFWSILADYLCSPLLTWLAFFAFRYLGRDAGKEEEAAESERGSSARSSSTSCRQIEYSSLARKLSLLVIVWDVACFVLSLMLLAWYLRGTSTTAATWRQLRSFLLGCRTIYALMMLPLAVAYALYEAMILVSSPRTGYNKQGACVRFQWNP